MYSFIHSSVIQVISVDERKSQPIQTDAETTARVVSSFINDYFPPLSGCNTCLLTLPVFWIYSLSAVCPDLCIDLVYESSLPMLFLLLLIELCLSDLFLLLIKLHMDLNVTDPSLHYLVTFYGK